MHQEETRNFSEATGIGCRSFDISSLLGNTLDTSADPFSGERSFDKITVSF